MNEKKTKKKTNFVHTVQKIRIRLCVCVIVEQQYLCIFHEMFIRFSVAYESYLKYAGVGRKTSEFDRMETRKTDENRLMLL